MVTEEPKAERQGVMIWREAGGTEGRVASSHAQWGQGGAEENKEWLTGSQVSQLPSALRSVMTCHAHQAPVLTVGK